MQAIEQLARASRSNGIERSECTERAGATCSVATDLTSLATAGAGAAGAGVIASLVEAAGGGAAAEAEAAPSGAGTIAAGAAGCCSEGAAAGAASPDGVAVAVTFAGVETEATPRQNTCTAPPCVPTNSVACRWCASTTNVCTNESVRTSSSEGAPGCKHSYSCTRTLRILVQCLSVSLSCILEGNCVCGMRRKYHQRQTIGFCTAVELRKN